MQHELVIYALRTPGLENLARWQFERYSRVVAAWCQEAATSAGESCAVPFETLARLLVAQNIGLVLPVRRRPRRSAGGSGRPGRHRPDRPFRGSAACRRATPASCQKAERRSGVMRVRRGALGLALVLCLAVVGCTSDNADPQARPTPSRVWRQRRGRGGCRVAPRLPPPRPRPGLTSPFGCGGGFTCATLRVPLDRADPAQAGLSLLVAMEAETGGAPAACSWSSPAGRARPAYRWSSGSSRPSVTRSSTPTASRCWTSGAPAPPHCAAPHCSRRWGSRT